MLKEFNDHLKWEEFNKKLFGTNAALFQKPENERKLTPPRYPNDTRLIAFMFKLGNIGELY